MSGITKILTRTPGELGSIKTNKSPIVEENKQLPAEQWNTAADAIIEIQTVIGEAANPSAGSITGVLSDHEERISELEQNGGGGTPDRIESPSGEAFVESTDDFMGAGVPGSAMIAESNGASGLVAAYPGHAGVRAGPEGSYTGGAGFDTSYDPTSDAYTLRAYGAPLQAEEPTESYHAATKGYVDARLPELESWYPVWAPVENVGSVADVECQYTRTYHASVGSLVTLEGTVMITPEAAGQCAVQVDLPVARVGSVPIAGMAMAMEVTPPGHVVAVASVDSTALTLEFVAEGADPYLVGFRISYRAA